MAAMPDGRPAADGRGPSHRIQAAGAGLGGIFTLTGYGMLIAEGKKTPPRSRARPRL
jgi:hypothetical protein